MNASPKPDGRKLDHALLEQLRFRAMELMDSGMSAAATGKALGFTRQAVSAWRKAFNENGADALRAVPVPGRPSSVGEDVLEEIRTAVIDHDPRDYGFTEALWTRDLVGALLHERHQVNFSPQWVGTLMRRAGLSPQRPVRRAAEADPAVQQAWRDEVYPQIRAEAAQAGATVYFGDEAGVTANHHAGRTWGEIGKTPVLTVTASKFRVNMISAVEQRGTLHFDVFTETCDRHQFIKFCEKLLADDGGTVFLIVDNSSIHRNDDVRQWVNTQGDRFKIFFLPTYSPTLNPDEWIWKNIKHDRIGRVPRRDAHGFTERVRNALQDLKEAPELIRGMFRDPHLSYLVV